MSSLTTRLRPILKITAKVILGLLVMLVLAAGLFVWRLSRGPINVGFLTPRLENLVESSLPEVDVQIGSSVINWDREAGFIGLQVKEVILAEGMNEALLDIPTLGVDLSLDRLLQGTLAVKAIEIQGVTVRLHRDLDGQIRLTQIHHGPPQSVSEAVADTISTQELATETEAIAQILDQVMAAPDPDRPLTYLEALRLADGELVITDLRRDFIWRGTDVNVTITRSPAGISSEVRLALPLPEESISAHGTLDFDRNEQQLQGQLSFSDVRLTSIATATGSTELAAFPFIFDATVSLDTDARGRLQHVHLQARGHSEHDDKVTLDVDCTSDETAADTAIDGEFTLGHVPLAQLSQYWPRDLAPNARRWVVTNINAGTVTAVAQFRLNWPGGSMHSFEMEEFAGTLDYEDLTVHYLRPLPPLRKITGQGTFGVDGLKFQLEPAVLSDLAVTDAVVDITGLSSKKDALAAQLNLAGPITTVLNLLANPSLDLLANTGIAPDQISGKLKAKTQLGIPLRGAVNFDTIALRFEGDTQAARLASFYRDLAADFNRLDFVVDNQGLDFQGLAVVATTALDFTWHESLVPETPQVRRIHFKTPQLEKPLLAALGLDFSTYLQGAPGVEVDAHFQRDRDVVLRASLDLASTQLAWPMLGWEKEAGVPGLATGVVRLEGFQPVAVDSLQVQAGTLSTAGSIGFDSTEGRLVRLDLTHFNLGDTGLEKVVLRRDDAELKLNIGGGSLDIVPLLAANDSESSGEDSPDPVHDTDASSQAPTPTSEHSETGSDSPLSFSCRVDSLRRISFGEDRYLQDVSVVLSRDSLGWRLLDIRGLAPATLTNPETGETAAAGSWTLFYDRHHSDADSLQFQADDAGALLRSLNLLDGYLGGRLVMHSEGRGTELPKRVHAKILIRDMIATDNSDLAKLFKTDIMSALFKKEKEGDVLLEEIRGDLLWDGNKLTVIEALGQSSSLIITSEGYVDRSDKNIALEGTVVSRNTVNSLLGSIPLLGDLLHGGKGFMAAYYKLTGPISEPDISVNPLKSLTPTFLKKWFGDGD